MPKRRKRANGSGGIRERGGKYRVAVTVGHDATGRQIRRYGTATTREDAERLRREFLAERDEGRRLDGYTITVGEFLDHWLEHKQRTVREKTYDGYWQLARDYLRPYLGSGKLADLSALDVERFVTATMRDGASAYTARAALAALKNALKQAVVWELLTRSPAQHVRAPAKPHSEMIVWTPAQARAFLTATGGDRLHALWYLALATGMRRGELLGLHWDRVV